MTVLGYFVNIDMTAMIATRAMLYGLEHGIGPQFASLFVWYSVVCFQSFINEPQWGRYRTTGAGLLSWAWLVGWAGQRVAQLCTTTHAEADTSYFGVDFGVGSKFALLMDPATERYQQPIYRSRALVAYMACVAPWVKPIRPSWSLMDQAFTSCVQVWGLSCLLAYYT